jgi:uncharacterized membrane protein YphA (DoxX/SURF4 family)
VPETTPTRLRTATRWLLTPATAEVPRAQAVGAAALRILVGLMWLYAVSWKNAPDFGEKAGSGLFKFTSYAVSHPVLPPFSWVVEHLVLPAFTAFGWAVLATETVLAVLLLTGAWVRLAAVLGIAQSLAIALSVAFAPHEWPWSYWLMIGVHGFLLVSSAGRVLAVDAVRAGVTTGRTLGQTWGAATALLGLFSIALSFGDPLAPRGPGLRSWDLELSLGEYNLIGGLVLVAAGALLLIVARGGPPRLGWAVAGIAAVAGVSLYVQIGFTDPLLGGTPTSAAYVVAVAVVGAVLARAARRPAV